MSVDLNKRSKNRRFPISRAPLKLYIGDCKEIDVYLATKTSIGWLIPKFINSLLRGVSQVLFVNNPFSGLLILLSIFWCDIFVGLAVILSATCAIFTALLLNQDSSLISAGLTTYNAVLVGSVTASLWTPLYSESLSLKIWSFIILGSVISVFVTSALANMLSSFKISLPCLTLPFNIVILVLFASLIPPKITSTPQLKQQSVAVTSDYSDFAPKNEMNNASEINGTKETRWTSEINTSTMSAALLTASLTVPKQSKKKSVSLSAISSTAAAPSAVSPVAPYLFNRAAREVPSEDEVLVTLHPPNTYQNASADSSLKEDDVFLNETDGNMENADLFADDNNTLFSWSQSFSGITLSMGQVYGINNLFSSIIIIMAVLIYSPMLSVMFLIGAAVSTITGLLFVTESFDSVYDGIWGYNGVLSAGAVGGFFIVLNCHSFCTAIVNVLFTVLIQRALIAAFASMRLPVFTLPFVLSTLIFLSVSSSGNQLPRVDNITVPETHRREFLERQQLEVVEKGNEQTLEDALETMKVTNEGIQEIP